MKVLLFAVYALLFIAACDSKDAIDSNGLTFLALGDSYTIGESVPARQRWPYILADSLRAAGVKIEKPEIVAKTGWTTGELDAALADSNITRSYGLVSLLIGVNNQYRGLSVERFRKEFKALLDNAVLLAGGKPQNVFVISIPDWGVTPFAAGRDRTRIAREIDEYNRIKKEETTKRGVLFINITDISRRASADTTLIAGDGLHPSGTMYNLWVNRITPPVSQRIKDAAR
ncbi:MAG TPA: GDSL-type esterase/lipase family protein [Candidatus Krumholzibacteriaceae bacterium]|nr:GDSL-type esterase/lipase family protein [Candidatus Krumholzibacteriaceae bacterium]